MVTQNKNSNLFFSEGVCESECKSLISAMNLPRNPFVLPPLLTPNPLSYPPRHPTIRSRDVLVNNTGKSVRCRYSDLPQFPTGTRAFQLRYKDSVRAH